MLVYNAARGEHSFDRARRLVPDAALRCAAQVERFRVRLHRSSMANGLVIHIARGRDRHTEVLSLERVRIGPGEDCHVRLAPDTPSDSPLLLELARTNGHYRITEFDPAHGPTINGVPIEHGAAIEDGDELRFAGSDLAVQFFPVRELPAVVAHRRAQVAPFIEQAAIEAAVTARRDDAKVFL